MVIVAGVPMPALATLLFQQPNPGNRHAAIYGLEHVVYGEQACHHGAEGFHLHAGAANGLGGDGNVQAAGGVVGAEIYRYAA